MTFCQLELEKNMTEISIHTLFSDFDVDPTLPPLFRTSDEVLSAWTDLEPKEICNKRLRVLDKGELERWGGWLHFITIMQWERWISERVHVHERKSSANILLKLDGSSVLCYLACPSGQADRQRRKFFFFQEVVLLRMLLASKGRSFLNDSVLWEEYCSYTI